MNKDLDPEANHLKSRLEEEQTKNAALSAELQMMDDCLAMVSHDLRTPLNFVTFALDMLLEPREKESQLDPQSLLLQCQKSLGEMARLVEDLLDFERIRTGTLRLDCARHDLLEIINEATTRFESLANAKGLVIHGPPAVLSGTVAYCDRNRIMQVLSNLLHNAIKFTPEGEVMIHLLTDREELEVLVMDTGPGIAAEDQATIFDRFSRAKSRDNRGLGLGLYIVKRIIEQHGGTVSVGSFPGAGSQFRFTVPRPDEAAQE